MKSHQFKTAFRSTLVLMTFAATFAITSGEINGQGKKLPPPSSTAPPPPRVSNTKLEVKASNGTITYWSVVMSTDSKSPDVTLRYSTTEPGATQAVYHLLDKAPSNDPRKSQAQGSHLLVGRGLGAITPNGEYKEFEINLTPLTPPAKTPRVIWVIVLPKNAQNQSVGVPSAPVKIVYARAPLGKK